MARTTCHVARSITSIEMSTLQKSAGPVNVDNVWVAQVRGRPWASWTKSGQSRLNPHVKPRIETTDQAINTAKTRPLTDIHTDREAGIY